ncbi:MAG: hypothetical protein ACPGXX_06350, partial [Planctomycetaceae bacterium]
VYKQASLRVSTAKLNRAVRLAIARNPPPIRKNRRAKIFFASQVAGSPPTIVVKCNDSTIIDKVWKRYLLGFLREVTPFREVPIRLILRGRGEQDLAVVETARAISGSRHEEPLDLSELSDEQLDLLSGQSADEEDHEPVELEHILYPDPEDLSDSNSDLPVDEA